MESKPGQHPSRYDVAGNVEAEYLDDARTVLVNKLGIADLAALQALEEEHLVRAYDRLLRETRTDTPLTCDLLRYVHSQIFGDLYDWAGRWRTVWISKPGITWPSPDFIEQHMRDWEERVLKRHPANSLTEDGRFCQAVAEIQGEFLVIHPFREGNARTVKLFTDLLAAETGRPLLVYEKTEAGQQRYARAADAAFKRDYAPMTQLIRAALQAARGPHPLTHDGDEPSVPP